MYNRCFIRLIYTFALLLTLTVMPLAGQQVDKYVGYYRSPMNIPIILSGNFGEIRQNHLHSGLDMRTEGREGIRLYAVADGYIARIGVAPAGFGRVLYIAHPNGTTSVYAHMQWFEDGIESYVSSERYRLKQHRVDLYPPKDRFIVKKGDFIGFSGNSGSSGGPHLHFEIRDANQRTMNVAKMGIYSIEDNLHPRIERLYVVQSDTIAEVPIYSTPKPLEVKKSSGTTYTLASSEPLVIGRQTHFVIEATDRKNNTHNTMGIYSVDALLDGVRFFSFKKDVFSFADTRYVNSLAQYSLQRGSGRELLRLALERGNRLPMYEGVRNRGVLALEDDELHRVKIVVEDDNNNISTLEFDVRRGDNSHSSVYSSDLNRDYKIGGVPFYYNRNNSRSEDGLNVSVPAGALYESIMYTGELIGDVSEATLIEAKSKGVKTYSPLYALHNEDIALHKNITISIAPSENIPTSLQSKLCFARFNDKGEMEYGAGRYEGGRVTVSTRSFGRYVIVADTTAPTVTTTLSNGANVRGVKSISFTLKDDFSGIASYNATIDGQWILFEQKGGRITHYFDSKRITYSGTSHKMVLTVIDNKGNKTTLERTLIR